MTIQIQRWQPDQCECAILVQWDDADPLAADNGTQVDPSVVHALRAARGSPPITDADLDLRQCVVHAGMAPDQHHTVLRRENSRKNNIRSAILTRLPALTQTTADGTVMFKPGVTFDYLFDGAPADRHVTITIGGASAAQKTNMQTWADTNIGAGKVTIQ